MKERMGMREEKMEDNGRPMKEGKIKEEKKEDEGKNGHEGRNEGR
jgi:hypothetical protein